MNTKPYGILFTLLFYTLTSSVAEPYERLFSLSGRALAIDKDGTLSILEISGGKTSVAATLSFPEYIWAANEGSKEIALLSGMSRENLSAPVKVTLFSKKLTDPHIVFEHNGERNQAGFIKEVGGTWWLNFFDSKYITKLATLDTQAKTAKEVASNRTGDAVDVGKTAFVGRVYGDDIGYDGDLRLIEDGKTTLLPSYRGVRAIKIIGIEERPHPRIIIADGWHQNYGKIAQGRLSLLTWNKDSERYSLELAYVDPDQYGFSKIESCGTDTVIALGNKKLVSFHVDKKETPQILATRGSEVDTLDFATIETNDACSVLILDAAKTVSVKRLS